MSGGDWVAASAMSLADDIRTGRRSSVEVVTAVLERIEAVTRASSSRPSGGRGHGSRAGGGCRPRRRWLARTAARVAVHDQGLLRHGRRRHHRGTVGWRDRVPTEDATVVERLRKAGGILVAKTNAPEFTWSDETDNDVYGRTSNPYDLARTPGGSSGGSAAIVAAGASPFDVGSDTGDSIRQPAHVCGVAGIKPTTGRVPRTGHSQTSAVSSRLHAARTDRPPGRGPGAHPADHQRARRCRPSCTPCLGDASAVRVAGASPSLPTTASRRRPPDTAAAVAQRGMPSWTMVPSSTSVGRPDSTRSPKYGRR